MAKSTVEQADDDSALDGTANVDADFAELTGPEAAREHRTVSRVMAILEIVVGSGGSGARLGELSGALHAPKSSVHGLAKGLLARGYLGEQDGRYLTGPAISSVLGTPEAVLPTVYRHSLEQLSAYWGETAMLATLVGDTTVYLDRVEPDTTIRAAPPL